MDDDRRDVLRRLEEWKRRVGEILQMFDDGFIPTAKRERAMRLYKALKDDLKDEHRRIRREGADDVERRPVGRAATYSGARWDRAPDQWRPFLNEAYGEFSMAVSRLQKALAESPFRK